VNTVMLGLGIAGLFLASCAESDAAETAEAQTELCIELQALQAQLSAMAPIDSSTSVAEIRQLRAHVAEQVEDVQEAAEELGEERVEDLSAAQRELDAAVMGLPDGSRIPAADGPLAPRFEAVEAARSQLSKVRCGGGPWI
jgi:ElaB/YqjD/DUF883 family membrane-anchored ribosome-binding protein